MSTIDNINGIYAKDTELRTGINTLRSNIINQTIKPLTVTQNGATYTADPSEGTYGYSPITVDMQEQPWQPLEDGYSNFWFELTNDTLSPWLNFSAKNNDAVIDWGDGSGEVALDTLTPTHTYAKAGKYVVKVKGVTGIGRQMSTAITALTPYVNVCKAIELSAEAAIGTTYAFCNMYGLEHVVSGTQSNVGRDTFSTCYNLKSVVMPLADVVPVTFLNSCQNLTDVNIGTAYTEIGQSAFNYCRMLKTFTIPSAVTSIDSGAFNACTLLAEIHCLPTTPPTLGTNVLQGLPNNFIIYVPVGTGETYKAAAGWSTYADHILEEGQTPNRAMLSRLAVSDGSEEDGSNER